MRLSTLALMLVALPVLAAQESPTDWIDPDTGHRIIRLSREPGSESLYFHQNQFTGDGEKLLMTTPGGISTVNLKTKEIELIVPDPYFSTNQSGIVVGGKTRQVYYVKRDEVRKWRVYGAHLDTKAIREIGIIPGLGSGAMLALNATETTLAGSFVERMPDAASSNAFRRVSGEGKGTWMARRVQARTPMQLFTMDVRTGETKTFHASTDWLNHVQMSPTDPDLILFCHEGPWHQVDRVWTIRTDGSGLKLIHPRTMVMEIAGHEFFGADGHTVWYDLQTPRGENFWLAGYNLKTGRRTWYQLQRNEWSVHYNVSRDGALFAGDGGHEGSVAKAPDGKWIYLFRPELNRVMDGAKDENYIQTGVFRSERLVNMKNHNYELEPNVQFTPDGKWIVFRSNMFGPSHVFAVEVAKSRNN